MYWWNLRALKTLLTRGPRPQPMAFRYAAAYATLSAVGMVPGLGANRWDVLGYIAGVVITLYGTIYCYRANGGPRGAYFLDRYFAVGFVVVMRLLPLLMLIVVTVLAVQELLGGVPDETAAGEAIAGVLFLCIAYWRIGSHIRSVSMPSGEVSVAPL